MSDHMKCHTLIVRMDAEHIRDEAVRVINATDHDARAQGIAIAVNRIALGLADLAKHAAATDVWQQALVAEYGLDHLIQALRQTLEQADPARQAAA